MPEAKEETVKGLEMTEVQEKETVEKILTAEVNDGILSSGKI